MVQRRAHRNFYAAAKTESKQSILHFPQQQKLLIRRFLKQIKSADIISAQLATQWLNCSQDR